MRLTTCNATAAQGYNIDDTSNYPKILHKTVTGDLDEARKRDIVQLLLDLGTDINTRFNRRSPLVSVAGSGTASFAEFLMDRGADVNIEGRVSIVVNGLVGCEVTRTPMAFALDTGHEAMVRLLLDRGANANELTALE
jgi:ankyrin repeat protein